MKKKVLTEEIIRIQKMMGVPTKLIMEAGPGGPYAEKGAKELWATIEKLFTCILAIFNNFSNMKTV